MKNYTLVLLFGPPGAGKTTIGLELEKQLKDCNYISVGSVMRDEIKLVPPFKSVNRKMVMNYVYDKFEKKHSRILVLDCNPFPEEMWDACKEKFIFFKKIFFFKINAPEKRLLERLNFRNRIDHQDFTYEQRLQYYHNNVEPVILELSKTNDIIELSNVKNEDVLMITNIIKSKIYE